MVEQGNASQTIMPHEVPGKLDRLGSVPTKGESIQGTDGNGNEYFLHRVSFARVDPLISRLPSHVRRQFTTGFRKSANVARNHDVKEGDVLVYSAYDVPSTRRSLTLVHYAGEYTFVPTEMLPGFRGAGAGRVVGTDMKNKLGIQEAFRRARGVRGGALGGRAEANRFGVVAARRRRALAAPPGPFPGSAQKVGGRTRVDPLGVTTALRKRRRATTKRGVEDGKKPGRIKNTTGVKRAMRKRDRDLVKRRKTHASAAEKRRTTS